MKMRAKIQISGLAFLVPKLDFYPSVGPKIQKKIFKKNLENSLMKS